MPLFAQGCTDDDSEFREAEFDDGDSGLDSPLDPDLTPDQDLLGPLAELTANIQVRAALSTQTFKSDEQGCSVPKSLVGVEVGDQIRITRNSKEYALYTVAEKRQQDNPSTVRLGLDARLRLGSSSNFSGSLSIPVPAVGLTDGQAQAASELVERLADDGVNTGLLVIAPHGGSIEINTHLQAESVTATLGCSSWICKGYQVGGGAYERWHITSTKINPRSFPMLAQVANRGFAYCVSFHGMSSGGVLIGGNVAPFGIKEMIRDAIIEAIDDTTVAVNVATADDEYNAESPKNLVNWLSAGGAGGVQIEQDRGVRANYWKEVSDAVASVFAKLLM